VKLFFLSSFCVLLFCCLSCLSSVTADLVDVCPDLDQVNFRHDVIRIRLIITASIFIKDSFLNNVYVLLLSSIIFVNTIKGKGSDLDPPSDFRIRVRPQNPNPDLHY
jgi:hypothetical protein